MPVALAENRRAGVNKARCARRRGMRARLFGGTMPVGSRRTLPLTALLVALGLSIALWTSPVTAAVAPNVASTSGAKAPEPDVFLKCQFLGSFFCETTAEVIFDSAF